jgi:hypothetical protein
MVAGPGFLAGAPALHLRELVPQRHAGKDRTYHQDRRPVVHRLLSSKLLTCLIKPLVCLLCFAFTTLVVPPRDYCDQAGHSAQRRGDGENPCCYEHVVTVATSADKQGDVPVRPAPDDAGMGPSAPNPAWIPWTKLRRD